MKEKSIFVVVMSMILGAASWMQAQSFTVLHEFNLKDGQVPNGALVQDADGNLYGTTVWGGKYATGGENVGWGTVFRLSPNGTETVLHSFSDQADGANPYAGLLAVGSDSLYGLSFVAGDLSCPDESQGSGCGTIFKIDKGGMATLYQFKGAFNTPPDGQQPYATLFKDSAGNLFGTTITGGITTCPGETDGCGTVFEFDSTGTEQLLYSFLGFSGSNSDGWFPESSLVEDSKGNLYGTTFIGGLIDCNSPSTNTGCGTVFELSPNGSGYTETVIYKFTGESDGLYPGTGLVIDSDGNLYGTTSQGGDMSCTLYGNPSYGCGAIFKLTPGSGGWTESIVYAFPGGTSGAGPISQLVQDSAGNFYGTAVNGGDLNCAYSTNGFPGCGVVFKVNTKGKESVLHAFKGTDGFDPTGGLLLNAATKTLYGTTMYGGDIAHCSYPEYYTGCGVVFKVEAE